jgi:hypothetical protein
VIGRLLPAGDLDVSTGLASEITGADYAVQKIRQRLLFIKGEWFLDTRLCMPWFEEILVKNPDMRLIQARVRDVILSVPGITDVLQVETAFDSVSRNLALIYRATYQGAQQISDLVASPVLH